MNPCLVLVSPVMHMYSSNVIYGAPDNESDFSESLGVTVEAMFNTCRE